MSAMLIFGEGRGSGKHPALDTRTFVDDASAAMMMTSSVDAQCFERAAAAAAMYVCDHVTVTIAPPGHLRPGNHHRGHLPSG